MNVGLSLLVTVQVLAHYQDMLCSGLCVCLLEMLFAVIETQIAEVPCN